jgi:hypothetical protein
MGRLGKISALFFLVIGFALIVPRSSLAAGCAGSCATGSDCTDNACKWCNTAVPQCESCCQEFEQAECPTDCVWESGECRNQTGVSCAPAIPELSSPAVRLGLIAGIVGFITALSVAYRVRRRKKTP